MSGFKKQKGKQGKENLDARSKGPNCMLSGQDRPREN